jgi:hypothetical protein
LNAKEIGSAKFGCEYIRFVSAHEAENENGLNGETFPDDE